MQCTHAFHQRPGSRLDSEEWSLSAASEGSGDPDAEWLDQNKHAQRQTASDTVMDSVDDDAGEDPAEDRGGGG